MTRIIIINTKDKEILNLMNDYFIKIEKNVYLSNAKNRTIDSFRDKFKKCSDVNSSFKILTLKKGDIFTGHEFIFNNVNSLFDLI
jgi:hypothetical protein